MRDKRVQCHTRVYEYELDLLHRIAELESRPLAAVLRDFILTGMHGYRKAHGMAFTPPASRSVLGYRNLMKG